MNQCFSESPHNQALILFAHGSSQARWREPFDDIVSLVRAQLPEVRVELAFLELMSPSMNETLAACAAAGVMQIRIVPLFFGVGKHVAHDLEAMIHATQMTHPAVAIDIAPALGQSAWMRQMMADYAALHIKADASPPPPK